MSKEGKKRNTKAVMATGVALAALGWSQTAQAQLNPAVDVCSGLSINRSAVTDIVGAVNEPIVGSVQGHGQRRRYCEPRYQGHHQ